MDDSDDEYTAPSSRAGTVDREDVAMDADHSGKSHGAGSASAAPAAGDGVSRRTRGQSGPSGGASKPAGGAGGAIADLKSANGGYSWEDVYQRSWDVVKDGEDDERSLDRLIQQMVENRKKKIMKNSSTPFQRGIIRTVIVVIDASSTMSEKDLRPTRFSAMLSLLADFIVEFFDQNPISQMGIVMMRNGIAYLVSEVSGSPQNHLEKLRQLRARQHNRYEPKGDPSLQNALEMARSLLKVSFGSSGSNNKNSKEILIILGALFTSDPGDIHRTIDSLVREEIKCRVIGLSAQVAICQELVNRTNHFVKQTPMGKKIIPVANGTGGNNYGIIMNEQHFRELLMDCVVPLPVAEEETDETDATGAAGAGAVADSGSGVPLIKVGFPSKLKPTPITMGLPQLSASAQEDEQYGGLGSELGGPGAAGAIKEQASGGGGAGGTGIAGSTVTSVLGGPAQFTSYECPQCGNRVSHLPTVCPVCDLMLILSTHLARSYHHLVPLVDYKEVPVAETYPSTHCYGCLLRFPEGTSGKNPSTLEQYTSSRYRCPKCKNDFCIDCDVFIHETLHNCPGCENNKR